MQTSLRYTYIAGADSCSFLSQRKLLKSECSRRPFTGRQADRQQSIRDASRPEKHALADRPYALVTRAE